MLVDDGDGLVPMSLTYSDFLYTIPSKRDERVNGRTITNSYSREDLTSSGGRQGNARSIPVLPPPLVQRPPYLPPEFTVLENIPVPLLQNAEESDQDFIILAEFSEVEGPIPLCTIPSDAPSKTDINLNSLVVQLMSTDYQVNTVGQFRICGDTQVMRTNVFTGVHVFMQYFTLYDIKARGFVRPFCFGFVSKDHVKLQQSSGALIHEFNKITQVLKQSNRIWFGDEVTKYISKLSQAKDEFLSTQNDKIKMETEVLKADCDGLDETLRVPEVSEHLIVDSEVITLEHVVHQLTEILNILNTVTDVPIDEGCSSRLELAQEFYYSNPETILSKAIQRLTFLGNSFESLNIPLVHPLKQKGESLRPITVLGQYGAIALIQELVPLYQKYKSDIIWTEMSKLTSDFSKHFELARDSEGDSSESDKNSSRTVNNPRNCLYKEEELCQVLEKLHASVPIPPNCDNPSGSYHSLSDGDEFDNQRTRCETENESIYFMSAFGSVESNQCSKTDEVGSPTTFSSDHLITQAASSSSPNYNGHSRTLNGDLTPKTGISPAKHKADSLKMSQGSPSPKLMESSLGKHTQKGSESEGSRTVQMTKIPWYIHCSSSLIQKGSPGYGVLRFCRQYSKSAHHVIFSILIGRPIIFCGSSRVKGRVAQILGALVPILPCGPQKEFTLIPWHQGVLMQNHLESSNKLIGLCIPERLSIHDLLTSRDQNLVTVLDMESKKLMGPAYSGTYFNNFEELVTSKVFCDDLSLISYIGSILTEIESKVFMYKCLVGDDKVPIPKVMKDLNLRNSDSEIVKHLGSLVSEVEEGIGIF